MRASLLLICMLIFWGCDNRKDPYINLDHTPQLTVQKLSDTLAGTSLSDSMKIGKPYIFKYNIIASENLQVTVLKDPVTDSVIINYNTISVNRLTEGISSYILQAIDPFGKNTAANAEITFFLNLPPICNYIVTQPEGPIPYEIDINASGSYDKDARWGGRVVNYKYIIGTDYSIQTELSDIQYVCDGPGQKTITVSCQDDFGAWSAPKTTYFTVVR